MDPISSPSLPHSSDPALIEWSSPERDPAISFPPTHSDDLDALRVIHEESIARQNKEGRVIQHRAWTTTEVFRSDTDYPQDTPLRARSSKVSPPGLTSSPASQDMHGTISSPLAYPPSSSPPLLKRALSPRAIGGFLLDDSDDENGVGVSERSPKRRMLNEPGPDSAPRSISSSSSQAKATKSFGAFIQDESDEEHTTNHQLRDSPPATQLPRDIPSDAFQNDPIPSAMLPARPLLFSTLQKVLKTCSGKRVDIRSRPQTVSKSFEQIVAARSTTKAGRARRSYYGVDIQQLVEDAKKDDASAKSRKSKPMECPIPSIETTSRPRPKRSLLWTEKYRARRFFDLVGDDRTHRDVLRWLKGWDSIVFPRSARSKAAVPSRTGPPGSETDDKVHRKILLLTGPPGLGKTTLAHVCATQAGYDVMEINASDERSSNVVKGRIRTSVGTESVKNIGVSTKGGQVPKMARPACVIVDEVDGVVGGSGSSGEGGFVKALIDLINLDAKNSSSALDTGSTGVSRKKKGDNFRLLRPLILICNDVYHPSLRPLRQSGLAEIIHIRKPPLEAVVNRLKFVFEKEGVMADTDAVRKLCEATWGMSSGPESRFSSSGTGEGDLRSVLVVGEWVAGRLRSSTEEKPRLTRRWVELNMLSHLSHGGDGTRSVGRGGAKEVVSRVFLTGAGFPKPLIPHPEPDFEASNAANSLLPKTQLHANELAKKAGMDRLREMVDTSGETDRIVTDIFSIYPSQPFNDDLILSKPNAAYEWLHFHDSCSSRVFSDQDWELMPYLSQPVLACHHLFASSSRHYQYSDQIDKKKWGKADDEEEEKQVPFSGPRADFEAREAENLARATILELQGNLSPTLLRSFRSPEDIATDLLPFLVRLLNPDVKPVVVGGSGDQRGIASVRKEGEREMVKRAVNVMSDLGVRYERGKLESNLGSHHSQWVYRMEPALDDLAIFQTAPEPTSAGANAPTRYAVLQVLDQEYQKNLIVRDNAARQARYRAGNTDEDADDVSPFEAARPKILNASEAIPTIVKKDFFGRVLTEMSANVMPGDGGNNKSKAANVEKKVWVSFHEGFSNAVRKPITVDELMRAL